LDYTLFEYDPEYEENFHFRPIYDGTWNPKEPIYIKVKRPTSDDGFLELLGSPYIIPIFMGILVIVGTSCYFLGKRKGTKTPVTVRAHFTTNS
jgi:hypothetical protein